MIVADTKNNVVLYTWHSKKNIALIKPFVDHLRESCGFQCHVVTSDASGKLVLLQDSVNAYTVNEILLAFADTGPNSSLVEAMSSAHTLDLHLNWLHTPRDPVLLKHPKRKATTEYYDWKRQQLISAYSVFLQNMNAMSVVTWNGSLLVTGALAEAAHMLGKPVFFMERGLLPGSLVIDPDGVNNDSSIAGPDWQKNATTKPDQAEMKALQSYCRQLGCLNASIVKTGKKKDSEAVLEQLCLTPAKPVILLPLQIESDSNIQNNSPYFKSMENLILSISSVLRGRDVQLVVKPHPEDRSRQEWIEALCSDSDVRCCWDLSLQSLFLVTDLVVVINSTVGLEALLQNKPVAALGRSTYDRKGFTLDLDDETSLGELIRQALDSVSKPHDNPNFWWFLKTLINRHTFFYEDRSDLPDVKPRLCETLGSAKAATSSIDGTAKMTGLMSTNKTLSQLMKGDFARLALVIGPLENLMGEIPEQITVLNRKASLSSFLLALTRRYDVMVCMEWPSNPILSFYLRLFRARQKVVLG